MYTTYLSLQVGPPCAIFTNSLSLLNPSASMFFLLSLLAFLTLQITAPIALTQLLSPQPQLQSLLEPNSFFTNFTNLSHFLNSASDRISSGIKSIPFNCPNPHPLIIPATTQ